MAKPLPEALRAPITDLASGKAWLDALIAADLSFHLEDDPEDIIGYADNEPIFSEADAPLIRERVGQLYDLEWGPRPGLGMWYCPIGYLNKTELWDPENQAKGFEEGAVLWESRGDLALIDRDHCPTYSYGDPGRFVVFRCFGEPHELSRHDTPEEAEAAMAEALPADPAP